MGIVFSIEAKPVRNRSAVFGALNKEKRSPRRYEYGAKYTEKYESPAPSPCVHDLFYGAGKELAGADSDKGKGQCRPAILLEPIAQNDSDGHDADK